jgi:hypothetical protein
MVLPCAQALTVELIPHCTSVVREGWIGSPARRLAVPPVAKLESAAEGGAGQEVELTGLAGVLEQPGALARHIGDEGHAVLVDQVEPRE